ncbi:hypothetical protein [Streptomyces sp. NPDC102264]|uniref:hypothetical protein n=1 Tax=Streptomyces sp. NPDC102264 TaxID=3366149 RepID=UPI00381E52E8
MKRHTFTMVVEARETSQSPERVVDILIESGFKHQDAEWYVDGDIRTEDFEPSE